jgi:hypothetical protein
VNSGLSDGVHICRCFAARSTPTAVLRGTGLLQADFQGELVSSDFGGQSCSLPGAALKQVLTRLPIRPATMLIINDIWMFMIGAAVSVQVSMVIRQILMAVPDTLLIMGRTPDHDADRQCATCHDNEPNKRGREADVGTQPSRQWVGNQPAGMG